MSVYNRVTIVVRVEPDEGSSLLVYQWAHRMTVEQLLGLKDVSVPGHFIMEEATKLVDQARQHEQENAK